MNSHNIYYHNRAQDIPWVFPNPRTEDRYYTMDKWLQRLCVTAGVRPFGLHALRRHCGSLLVNKYKRSTKAAQRLLRHKRVSTTERYLGIINRDFSEVVNLLGSGIAEGQEINEKEGQLRSKGE